MAGIRSHGGSEEVLDRGWEVAGTVPDEHPTPSGIDGLAWAPARVPGTVASALAQAGLWDGSGPGAFDERDWWFRTRFEAAAAEAGEEVVLHLDGLATVCEVFLNGVALTTGASMFLAQAVDVGARLEGENELAIRFRALAPLLAERRRPRARWRTRLVANGNLRFFRTMLIGRAPGFAPGPAAVGPWRPVRLSRRRGVSVERLHLRTRLEGEHGVLAVEARLRPLAENPPVEAEVELDGPSGEHHAQLEVRSDEGGLITATGEMRVPDADRWWPHTHGTPALHTVRLLLGGGSEPATIDCGRVGFRTIEAGPGAEHRAELDGLDLQVNALPVFVRGAIWTPVDPVGLAPGEAELRATLESVRDAGMNMVRVAGIGAYESPAFHDLCDELGIMVWQDFMFANFDYPIADPDFRRLVEQEAEGVLTELARRPSLAVLCGNSEVSQQAAMVGLDRDARHSELFDELLPAVADRADADAIYLPSAPCGGDLPFRTDRGVANYFGVGAYLRPLEDARRAEVRFASECLAFANVPSEDVVAELAPGSPSGAAVHEPSWKRGVPRDAGSGWDFDDVRDHYLKLLFGVDPIALRSVDPPRYLELSRAVSGEVMAEVFGEWRRIESPCAGGLVLWLRDLAAGAGWGLLDHRGEPKAAYHHLRRALAPVAVWTTDEGLGGVAAHVANDRPQGLRARLRVALYRDLEQQVEGAERVLELPGHGAVTVNVEELLGRFVDASWAYRFGPPGHDVIVASLETLDDERHELISQALRFVSGRPTATQRASDLGLELEPVEREDGPSVLVRSRRLAYGVRLHAPGFALADDAFSIEPGGERTIALSARAADASLEQVSATALNLNGRVRLVSGS